MRHILLVAAAVMALASPAFAGEAATNWSGCYIGGVAGYGWGSTDHTYYNGAIGLDGTHVNGRSAGVTLGCNLQQGKIVTGIENDLNWTKFFGHGMDISNPSFDLGTKLNWLDTLRGRIGYATGSGLLYLTAGVAFAEIRDFQHADLPDPSLDLDRLRFGWTAGAGFESMITANLSWKLEYLYVRFNDKYYDYNEPVTGLASTSSNLNQNILRIGLNYRFPTN